jgi:hypothetical protein
MIVTSHGINAGEVLRHVKASIQLIWAVRSSVLELCNYNINGYLNENLSNRELNLYYRRPIVKMTVTDGIYSQFCLFMVSSHTVKKNDVCFND